MPEDPSTRLQIFLSFLKLGCVAFGDPVAHLGYFQEAFVRQRKWLSECGCRRFAFLENTHENT